MTKIKAQYDPNYGGERPGAGRKPTRKNKVKVAGFITPEEKEALLQICKQHNLSIAKIIRQLVVQAICEHENNLEK